MDKMFTSLQVSDNLSFIPSCHLGPNNEKGLESLKIQALRVVEAPGVEDEAMSIMLNNSILLAASSQLP